MLKALFVLEIFTFLSAFPFLPFSAFKPIEKWLDKKAKVNFKTHGAKDWQDPC